jgi:GDP-4-dehydro-6-deoxy-D-mannose reductase
MRALITGSHGFVGPHLAEHLRLRHCEVRGFDLREGEDIRRYEDLHRAVESFSPDLIFHLAALTWPRESLSDPRRALETNLGGTLNLLEAVRHTGSEARILLAGSSEEYGYEHRDGLILDEDSTCWPTTPYGVSKLAATTLGMTYFHRYGLNVVATRAFNHTGPGQQPPNAVPQFARKIVAVERGDASEVTHGDLSSKRDFTDVRDIVWAYARVISAPPGIYNVCSGQPVPMSDIMSILVQHAKTPVTLTRDPKLGTASSGFPQPSCALLKRVTGWEPMIKLETTLTDMLEYWRNC